ncbi:hypothetical protein E6B08_04780 [Pseudomonas putida]|uniref:Uncharacterized protein n=1 Tax=Pseudomonas putida TaxID=303 RepID=A0A4D6X464_PSEPU|nr:hypothetical protein [Pseudomonas putida]QCI10759.1 hypothetical protein E6B08_04780 [Pseudomonas putida]
MQFAFVANELKEEQAQDRNPACRSVQRKGLNILAAAVFATLTSTATLAADDISGVAIGSSLAEAKAAIAEANANYEITPLMLTNGQEAGVTAKTNDLMPWTGSNNAGGPSDEFAALLNDAGKVWFVARVQRFDKGGRIKLDALKEALIEKFGQPSGTTKIGTLGFNWQYFRDGKQWTGSGVAPCQGNGTTTTIPGVSVTAPRSFSPKCGKIVSVHAATQPDMMVPYYTITITDAKGMFDELAARDAKEEADRKQKLADEQAKAVKPKI